jgi:hypothetical protein
METQLQSISTPASLLRPHAKFALLLACALALGVAGCPREKVHAKMPTIIPPVPAPAEPPTPPYILGQEPTDTTLAMIPESLPTPPPERPHPAAPRHSGSDPSAAPKPAAPAISPEISASDQAVYERRIDENLKTAESNLRQASAHQLNATQKDMAEKIKGFVEQAHDAMQAADWTRAQNLAEKAQVLSSELASSF